MEKNFTAVVIGKEINLNRIAEHFGINRKYKWEESLVLGGNALSGIVSDPTDKIVCIFSFGSMVFVNCAHHEIMDVVNYIQKVMPNLNVPSTFKYFDEYKLIVSPETEPAITNDYLTTSQASDYQPEIVATVLAKSVALEKIEKEIDQLMDKIEDVVNYLHLGKFSLSDEQLAKISGSILGFKLNTLSYIMLLDKPDITWVNEEAAELFNELTKLFELEERYQKIRHKTETLLDIIEVFTALTHAKRGNRLEWAVIILIAIELILSLIDLFVLR
jgi:uncharacterized Rmd1/YagE family protein